MKQVLLLLLLLIGIAHAGVIDEKITDIYFGNGVWNDDAGAKNGRDELSRLILKEYYHNKIDEFRKHHFTDRDKAELNENVILLSFNWTGTSSSNKLDNWTKMWDIVEMYQQLKSEGQIPPITLWEWLLRPVNQPLRDFLDQHYLSIDGENLEIMVNDYNDISFKKSHRVLLVAHSQGNAYGNRVFDHMQWQKKYFKMVSVATPVGRVFDEFTPQVKLECDLVVGYIPGALPWDTNCTGVEEFSGHEFVKSYLLNPNSLKKIVQNVANQLQVLDTAPSQWQKSATTNCGCKQRIQVEHKFDASLSTLMKGLDVIAFDEADKLYPTGFDYVKASVEGDSLVKYDSGDICIDLLDANATKIDDFKGRTPVATSAQGDIEVTLSWNSRTSAWKTAI